MARYWVGGTNLWNTTAGSKWAATSGGAGGASVPTLADDVFFDANSSGTCTISGGNSVAKSINCTGFTGGIDGTSSITVAGSITLGAGQTYTHTGTVTITGTGTLTTSGKAFSSITVDGDGITVTLGDALNLGTRRVNVRLGTFDTANYSVTGGGIGTSNLSNTRTINLGSSTLSLSSNGSPESTWAISLLEATNLTFDAGTSQINLTGSSGSIIASDQTFHNVSFTSAGVGFRRIFGANTFNNLTINASATGLTTLVIDGNQTVNDTFTCAGTSAIRRGFVRSVDIGTTSTITANAISVDDCDFRDITIAGAAAPISPTRAGDCGGNSGITFPAAKTVYRVGIRTSTTAWAGLWALTSGGTSSLNNFPLAQDTAVINDDAPLIERVLIANSYNIGSLDASTRTIEFTLNFNETATYYGSVTLGSGVTVVNTSAQTFSGRGTQTFTSAGKTITCPIIVNKPAGAFELGDAYESSNTVTLTQGTFDAKNYNVTCLRFVSNNSNTRTLTMGSGLWTLSGAGASFGFATAVWNTDTATNLILNKDTADILLSNTTTTDRFFLGGGLTFNKLTIGGVTGTSIVNLLGQNTFTALASTKTVAHTITFHSTDPTIGTWSVTGTSGNVVTVNSNAAGTRRTINLTNATSGIDFLDVKDIGITDPNKFYVGDNSIDSGNNLNVIFTAAPAPTTATGNMFMLFQ